MNNFIKIILSSLFIWTAVIKSADVTICLSQPCIVAHYQTFDNGTLVASEDSEGFTWPQVIASIKSKLHEHQAEDEREQAFDQKQKELQKDQDKYIGRKIIAD